MNADEDSWYNMVSLSLNELIHWLFPTLSSSYVVLLAGDVDSRSIGDQERTKRHWEDKIATGDVSLFPRQPEPNRKASIDIADFKSEVETESITLSSAKQHWEKVAAENENEKNTQKTQKPALNNNLYYDVQVDNSYVDEVDNDEDEYESAIDREIRLAQQREEDLRMEKEARITQMKSEEELYWSKVESEPDSLRHSVRVVEVMPKASQPMLQASRPIATPTSPTSTLSSEDLFVPKSPPSHEDTASELARKERESIIERDIRENQRREEMLRREGNLPGRHVDKVRETFPSWGGGDFTQWSTVITCLIF